LQKADHDWRSANSDRSFSRSNLAALPSQWATQVSGHTLIVSSALHLQLGIAWTRPLQSMRKRLLAKLLCSQPCPVHESCSRLPFIIIVVLVIRVSRLAAKEVVCQLLTLPSTYPTNANPTYNKLKVKKIWVCVILLTTFSRVFRSDAQILLCLQSGQSTFWSILSLVASM
jgi:hypothetical protein